MKILSQMYLWTRKSLLNFGNHPDWDRISLGRDLHFPSGGLFYSGEFGDCRLLLELGR